MRGNRVNLKNVPTGAWVTMCVAIVSVVAAYVVMPLTGADGTELRSLINQLINLGTLIAAGGSVIYSGAAAKNAQDAKDQTVGKSTARDRAIAETAARAVLEQQQQEP